MFWRTLQEQTCSCGRMGRVWRPASASRPMSPKDIAIALVPPLSWGAGFTLAKPAVEQFQPLFMMAMIYLALVIVLVPTARGPIRTPWLSLVAIAAFAVPIQGVFIFL